MDRKSTVIGVAIGVVLCLVLGGFIVGTHAQDLGNLLHITIVTPNGSVVSDSYAGNNTTVYINPAALGDVPSVTAVPSSVPSATPAPTADLGTGSPTNNPTNGPTASPGATSTPAPSDIPSVTPTATASPSDTPTPTVEPTPTATPVPTPTPVPTGMITGTYHGDLSNPSGVGIVIQGNGINTHVFVFQSNGGNFQFTNLPYGTYHIWGPGDVNVYPDLESPSMHVDIGTAPTSTPSPTQ